MSYPKNVWNQLKNKTVQELRSAAKQDGFTPLKKIGPIEIYGHPDGRLVSFHMHPKKTFGRKTLNGLFEDLGWSVSDLKRLKLVKKH